MSDPDSFKPEDEEEYHFSDDPDMNSFEAHAPAVQAQSASEQPNSGQPATESKKKFSLPDFSQLIGKNFVFEKMKPLVEAIRQKFILRVSLIVCLVLLIIALFYRCSSNPIAEKSKEKIKPTPVAHMTANKTQEIIVSRVPALNIGQKTAIDNASASANVDMSLHQDRVSRLEKDQANLQTQISNISAQMLTLNSNINTTATNLKQITDQMSQLALAVQNEAKINAELLEKVKMQNNLPISAGRMGMPGGQVQYFLQAIIPGRAWLVSSEGETLTVSRGSPLGNYGKVNFIDAASGRVLTSSGQIITFSRDDS